jgi:hypothetical protein
MTQRSPEADLETAFATLKQRRAEALSVGANPLFTENRERLAELAAHYRIPAIYSLRGYADADGIVKLDSMLAGLIACPAANQIRLSDQPQSCPGARRRHLTESPLATTVNVIE